MSFRLLGSGFPFPALFQEQLGNLAGTCEAVDQLLRSLPAANEGALRVRDLEAESRGRFQRISTELALVQIRPLESQALGQLSLEVDGVVRTLATLAARAALPPPLSPRPSALLVAAGLREADGLLLPMLAGLQRAERLQPAWESLRGCVEQTTQTLTVALAEVFEDAEAARRNPLEAMRWVHIFDRFQEALGGLERIAWVLLGMELRR